jgi:hypothetical protein
MPARKIKPQFSLFTLLKISVATGKSGVKLFDNGFRFKRAGTARSRGLWHCAADKLLSANASAIPA